VSRDDAPSFSLINRVSKYTLDLYGFIIHSIRGVKMTVRQCVSIVAFCFPFCFLIADSSAIEIAGNQGEEAPGNFATPNPAAPTETVQFTLNTDSITYGNECNQRNAFDGNHSLDVHAGTRSINLTFVEPAPMACLAIYDPVTGVRGEVGPLFSGSWNIQDDFGNFIELQVLSVGDSNRDGFFNTKDLVDVFIAGEYEDDVPGNSTWEEGDWNGDGDFNTSDLVVAFQFFASRQGIAVVPEPGTITLALAGLLLVNFRARRSVCLCRVH
jgi:hypothetical protein